MDAFAGTFSADKACYLLFEHRRYIKCIIGSSGVAESMLQLFSIISRHVLTMEFDISGDEYICTLPRYTLSQWKRFTQIVWMFRRSRKDIFQRKYFCWKSCPFGYIIQQGGAFCRGRECYSKPTKQKMAGETKYKRHLATACSFL